MSKDWDKYIDEAWSEADKDARIAERNAWLDENAVVYGPDHVTSYYVNKNEDHIESGTGRLLSTKESRAKQDIPQWKKFEIGRLEDVDGHIVPGPNALEKDFKQYGKNIAKTGRAKTMKPTKIMPGDMTHTPLEKALNWASETHHGKAHQNRWNRVASTMGEPNGYDPYTFDEVKKIWEQFGKNARWTVAIDWFDSDDEDVRGMVEYHSPLTMQGHYSLADWDKLHGSEATICKIEGFDKLTIWDSGCQMPNFWLEEDFAQPTEQWRLMPDGGLELVRYFYSEESNGGPSPTVAVVNQWRKNHGMKPMDFPNGVEPYPPECVWKASEEKIEKITPLEPVELPNLEPAQKTISEIPPADESNRLTAETIDELPKMDETGANQFYKDNKGDPITWVTQREPSVGPHVVSVLFHCHEPVAKKKSRFDEFSHLPYWTKAQAEKYFIQVKKVGSYSRKSLDGHWNTVKGYCTHVSNQPMALAATQEMEDIEREMDDAIRANDWAAVARLATKMIQLKSK